jgi:hypothetical protein
MCRRSQECNRISLHRTFLVPLQLLMSANPPRYRDSCCTTIQLQHTKSNYYYYNNNIQIQLLLLLQQHTNPTTITPTTTTYKSNYYYYNIQIKIISLTHMGWTFFLFCVASKRSIQLVLLPIQGPERTYQSPNIRTTCQMF